MKMNLNDIATIIKNKKEDLKKESQNLYASNKPKSALLYRKRTDVTHHLTCHNK